MLLVIPNFTASSSLVPTGYKKIIQVFLDTPHVYSKDEQRCFFLTVPLSRDSG